MTAVVCVLCKDEVDLEPDAVLATVYCSECALALVSLREDSWGLDV